MKILNQTITILALCWISIATARAQNLAVFKIPDSSRPFLFNLRPPYNVKPSTSTTNSTQQGVEGLLTILAKGFKTESRAGVVVITFYDAVVCQASRSKGEELGSPVGSPVMVCADYAVPFPAETQILVGGHFVPLAEVSEKSFNLPTLNYQTYTGEDAIKKLKELGLQPPEDMDWEKATNK